MQHQSVLLAAIYLTKQFLLPICLTKICKGKRHDESQTLFPLWQNEHFNIIPFQFHLK